MSLEILIEGVTIGLEPGGRISANGSRPKTIISSTLEVDCVETDGCQPQILLPGQFVMLPDGIKVTAVPGLPPLHSF